MKVRLIALCTVCLVVLAFSAIAARASTLITFDELSETGSGSFLANGYQGLNWINVLCVNAILYPRNWPFQTNGVYYGMASASNVVMTLGGGEIDSVGADFDFLSASLTAGVSSNLNIELQGFNGAGLLYDTNVVANATSSTLFTFNYTNIDRLAISIGQQDDAVVMDNLTIGLVPEPSTVLLAALGALSLCALLKRRRL